MKGGTFRGKVTDCCDTRRETEMRNGWWKWGGVEDGVEKLTYADSWDAINSYLSRTAVWELCSPVRRGGEAVEPVIGKRWRASSGLQRRKWRWRKIHDEERQSHDHRESPTLCDFSASYGDDWRAFCINMSKSNVRISVRVHKFSP